MLCGAYLFKQFTLPAFLRSGKIPHISRGRNDWYYCRNCLRRILGKAVSAIKRYNISVLSLDALRVIRKYMLNNKDITRK